MKEAMMIVNLIVETSTVMLSMDLLVLHESVPRPSSKSSPRLYSSITFLIRRVKEEIEQECM
jgi:hypothetical protein